MATHSLHFQIAAVEAVANASPDNGALAAAVATLREVAMACAPRKHAYSDCPCCHNNWQVDAWPHEDRLVRAMEGLMP